MNDVLINLGIGIFAVFGFIAVVAAMWYAGQLYERSRWNDLIERGLLPPPGWMKERA